jgi:hypothetical protein
MEAEFVKAQAKSSNAIIGFAVRWCISRADRDTGRLIYTWLVEYCKQLADRFEFEK